MRFIVIAALLIGAMVLVRWLTFTSSDGSVSATVDTMKAKEDTSEAVEKGKEVLDDSIDRLKEVGQKVTEPTPDVPEKDLPDQNLLEQNVPTQPVPAPDVPERSVEELRQD